MRKFKSSRKKRFRTSDRLNFPEKTHDKFAETPGVYIDGEYDRRMTGLPPGGWGGDSYVSNVYMILDLWETTQSS